MLHGKTTIELQNTKTGRVDRFVDHNLVTVGIGSYYNDNPYGAAHRFIQLATTGMFSRFSAPPPQVGAVGGIALFGDVLTENTKPWFEHAPLSYASCDSYAGANTERGQLNSGLSTIISGGYRWVYDFGSERANHTFKSLGLTSRMVGRGPAFSDVLDQNVGEFANISDNPSSSNRNMYGFVFGQIATNNPSAQIIAVFDETAYAANIVTGNTFELIEYYAPSRFGWNFRDTRHVDTYSPESLVQKAVYTLDNGWIAVDLVNRCIYTLVNSGNASGNATITINKYEYPLFNKVSSTLVVSAPLMASQKMKSIAIVNGYIYMPAYDSRGVYKINISNSSDVSFVAFPEASTPNLSYGTAACGTCVAVDSGIIFPDNTFWATNRPVQNPNSPFNVIPWSDSSVWGLSRWYGTNIGGNNVGKFSVAPCDFYLATKNNLENEIVKTNAQTMRVTYELTTT